MPTLVILSGMNVGASFVLSGREVLIGRDSTCDIPFASRTVSRQHCRLLCDSDVWYVEDLDSVNGTHVNGKAITKRTRLGDRDRIRIYDIVLGFGESTSDDQPTVSARSDGDTVRAKVEQVKLLKASETRSDEEPNIVAELDARSSADLRAAVNADVKLRAILDITHSVGSSLDLEYVLPRILEGVVKTFPQTDRAYILQEERAGGRLIAKAIHDLGDSSDTINPVGGEMASRVMAEGSAFLSSDAINDERLDQMSASIFEERIRSFICAPLLGPRKKPLGVIHVETHNPRAPFNQLDLDVLVSVALMAGQAVEYVEAHEAQREFDARKRDLRMAHDVQMHFLPSRAPNRCGYEFFQHYRAANDMGGDYYDYIELPDGRLAIVQGDVSGKGAAAALVMARLCSDVRYWLLTEPSPAQAMQRLNRQFCERDMADGFVTLVIAVLDPHQHRLTLVNSGHMNPLLRNGAGEVKELTLQQMGTPVGVDPAGTYTEETLDMQSGDAILLYTDGLSDSMNSHLACFGTPSIREVLAQGGTGAAALGTALLNAMERHAAGHLQNDDVCILCLQRSPTD
ncbi:SpoIIE family protein phosphatase [Lignipirellula cremea]|uniref:Phosphoserine phosphatase RsbP n=1 Tax=Lignipirellula cremea TaxID=2528010 RepID=A0A518DUY0_9BACT|nr:SpoIIE family protein phosphatase [Lignipirellula cremea]QDU95645.1 Phosphoserine phosphatase RsbP [Lignipirellula cremea]